MTGRCWWCGGLVDGAVCDRPHPDYNPFSKRARANVEDAGGPLPGTFDVPLRIVEPTSKPAPRKRPQKARRRVRKPIVARFCPGGHPLERDPLGDWCPECEWVDGQSQREAG